MENSNLTAVVITMLAFYWNRLDYHAKALMPWKLMFQRPQSAERNLLLDYVSGNLLNVLFGAIRHRHVPVITSTMIDRTTKISVLTTFDGTKFNASAVDSFPVLVASSILSGNLSIDYPSDTNIDYAVDAFSVQATLDG
jgi:hypothetical protein